MSSTKTPYRHIPGSSGGTFNLNDPEGPSETRITRIGTTGCTTCVGLYLPIDDKRCFVAHIHAFVHSTTRIAYRISEDEGQNIRAAVYQKLRKESQEHEWSKSDVLSSLNDPNQARRVVVVCRQLNDELGRPGQYVIDAISDFLDGQVNIMLECRQGFGGFVVDHSGAQATEFIFRDENAEADHNGKYHKLEQQVGEQEWLIGVAPELSGWNRRSR